MIFREFDDIWYIKEERRTGPSTLIRSLVILQTSYLLGKQPYIAFEILKKTLVVIKYVILKQTQLTSI